MQDGKKINLSAMISSSNKSNTEVSNTEAPLEEKNQEVSNTGSVQQISDSIEKSEPIAESKKVDIKNLTSSLTNEKKEDKPSSQDITQKNEIKSVKDKEKPETVIKKKKVDLKNISTSVSKNEKDNTASIKDISTKKDIKAVENTIEKVKEAEEEIKKEKPEVKEIFKNYSSDFNGKAHNIIKEIKKLKNLKKTNPIFLSFIILTTVLGVSFLFYVDPENHSYTNYKASLLGTYNKINSTIQTNTGTQSPQQIVNTLDDNTSKFAWSDLSIKQWGFNVKIESQTGSGGTLVYKFEGVLYTSKDELDEAVQISITLKKTKRIKSVISENFKRK